MFFLIMPCGGGGSVMENGQSAIMPHKVEIPNKG